ncbi:hydrophobin [Trametes cingulata]|nr:hydrophobin [Trametes cingulata]
MFAKVAVYTLAAFTALAAATPVPQADGSCNTGAITCCQDIRPAGDAGVTALLGLLGVAIDDVTASVGLNCSPISVVGVASGNACSSTPVCCQNNNVGGLVSIGCVPVIL